jgi:hypothetical protein
VLSWTCRRFRARFTPGSAPPHRRACRDCEAFAAAVERAAGARLPLPARLRQSLGEIADPPEDNVLPFPVPRLPLPGSLAARLCAIPAAAVRQTIPEWVRDPRYAVAASALLALVLGPFLTGAADRSAQAVGALREEVAPILERAGESGKKKIGELRSGTAEAYGEARCSAEDSLQRLDTEVSGLSAWLSTLSTVANDDFTNPDPRGTPAGSMRRR